MYKEISRRKLLGLLGVGIALSGCLPRNSDVESQTKLTQTNNPNLDLLKIHTPDLSPEALKRAEIIRLGYRQSMGYERRFYFFNGFRPSSEFILHTRAIAAVYSFLSREVPIPDNIVFATFFAEIPANRDKLTAEIRSAANERIRKDYPPGQYTFRVVLIDPRKYSVGADDNLVADWAIQLYSAFAGDRTDHPNKKTTEGLKKIVTASRPIELNFTSQ